MNKCYVHIASTIGEHINVSQKTETNVDFVSKCADPFDKNPSIVDINNTMNTTTFSFRHTTAATVEQILLGLNVKKATGQDRIPPKLVKPAAGPLSHHLANSFNQCVDTSEFPDDAKLAEVVPLYKKDDNLNMTNDRPVSILPSMSKVLEQIILHQMSRFLREILDPRIAAYRHGYSCQDVLLKLIDDWKKPLEKRRHVGAVLMDLSKAFDCLPHQLLVAKLKAYGVCGKSCALIWSYLSGRNQRVRVGSSTSEWLLLTKGVPQGSGLGPVVFNLFINYLYAAINTCDLYNYADDNTISACCDSKQQVIDTLMAESTTAMKWFEANMMQANPGKFQAIILKEPSDSITTLTVGNTIMTTDDSVKLLGVHLDRLMDFNKQIKELCRKAACQLNVLQRLARHLDQDGQMAIFRAFIMSHFIYCLLVWHFCGATNTNQLERIQFCALRFVFLDFESDYATLLDRAGLPTLERSRKRDILIDVFKNLMNQSPAFMWNSYKTKLINCNLRNTNTLCIPHTNTTRYGLQTLTAYGVKLWNSLVQQFKQFVQG